ncbi:MAG: hypothetical protein IPJ01_10045 [Micavibrio sp.]|nr:hypothetical protein [Micavibrio sp.]
MDKQKLVIDKIDKLISLSKKKVELLEELKESTLFEYSKYNIRQDQSGISILFDSKTGKQLAWGIREVKKHLTKNKVDINSMDVCHIKNKN